MREGFSDLEAKRKIEKPSGFLTRWPELLAAAFTLEPRWAPWYQQWGSVEEQDPASGPDPGAMPGLCF